MKLFKFITLFIFILCAAFHLTSCSSDYALNLGNGIYLFKLGENDHSLIMEGEIFYNYKNKNVDLDECLKNNCMENCYGLGGDTIIEPNVEKIAIVNNYIIGTRTSVLPSRIDQSILEELTPLQKDGYFFINIKEKEVKTGLSEQEFNKLLSDLNIKNVFLKEVDDRVNSIKTLPRKVVSLILRFFF